MSEQVEIAVAETPEVDKRLIVVTQLPIIKENLKALSSRIDAQVQAATSLVCTEATVVSVKKTRTALKNQFAELEGQRKDVKKAIADPYDSFLSIYKEYVSDKFKFADAALKSKIDEVENGLRAKKEATVRAYFIEYSAAMHTDFLKFSDAHLNVTLSATEKSLKEQSKEFVDRVAADVEMIESQEDAAEIMAEYKSNGYGVSQAIMTVNNRHREIERQKALTAQREEQRRKDAEVVRQVHEAAPTAFSAPAQAPVQAPVAESAMEQDSEEVLICGFRVKATRAKLKELKAFIDADPAYELQ